MKTQLILISLLVILSVLSYGQFNEKNYIEFRNSVKDMSFNGLNNLYAVPGLKYYKGYNQTPAPDAIVYLDSVVQKLKLTENEIDLLMQNHFVVTERLSDWSFGSAYQNYVFNKDLPVFISTDLILHSLHTSYDEILKAAEASLMMPNIKAYITDLYDNLPAFAAKYESTLPENIGDVDLYLTVAMSLMNNSRMQTRYASQENYNQIMEAIGNETLAKVQLFTNSKRTREIDFSQFKVRGHYVYTEEDKWRKAVNLEPYFKTMMWLGRIDFPLTPPPTGGMEPEWKFEEIQRMNISAFILNGMMQASAKKILLQQNNEIITYLVGESDNFTTDEFAAYTQSKGINDATQLTDSLLFVDYFDGLSKNPEFAQKYMGAFYFVNPTGDKPDVLPVSFLVSGQRFIIDSYVLANVVFDRIIYKEAKVKRMMPDPLDVLYSLGNNDALHFLEDEMNTYPYATQLALMRYLIDTKEAEFWNESLYNSWLSSIRALNPSEDKDNMPFFMRTGAWHQQKMNTQLAAWTQLRHDNLLYAKPSYTGGASCSFPYSYVEPYPDFFKRLGDYANNAADFFSGKQIKADNQVPVDQYFRKFAEVMSKLELLAQKELNNQAFNSEEENWLRQMLIKNPFQECGAIPFSGWILDLYWESTKVTDPDFITVDIHTQPTDESGNIVGKVLHAGLGALNLGVCLAKIPGTDVTAAYTGAFMSYYEYITDDFLRVNDQEWESKIIQNNIPGRPEWINSYLANKNGNAFPEQKSLPTSMLIINESKTFKETSRFALLFPNPTNSLVKLQFTGPVTTQVNYAVIDIWGRKLQTGQIFKNNGTIDFSSLPTGIYVVQLNDGEKQQFVKVMKE